MHLSETGQPLVDAHYNANSQDRVERKWLPGSASLAFVVALPKLAN
jgi:hypothetical protein